MKSSDEGKGRERHMHGVDSQTEENEKQRK